MRNVGSTLFLLTFKAVHTEERRPRKANEFFKRYCHDTQNSYKLISNSYVYNDKNGAFSMMNTSASFYNCLNENVMFS